MTGSYVLDRVAAGRPRYREEWQANEQLRTIQ